MSYFCPLFFHCSDAASQSPWHKVGWWFYYKIQVAFSNDSVHSIGICGLFFGHECWNVGLQVLQVICASTSQCFSYLECDALPHGASNCAVLFVLTYLVGLQCVLWYLWCTTISLYLTLPTAMWNVISKSLSGNVTSWECLNVSLQGVCLHACTYHGLLPYSGVFPFSLCDLMQLALIKSHMGAFDSKVPVSPLSNLSVAQAGRKRNLRQAFPL